MSDDFILDEYADHFDSILENGLEKESDRAVVIIAVALFDEALLNLLKASLVPNPTTSDDLFDSPNAPFSTFSTKISVTHRLGLISKRMARDLHIIRKIRNQFAHNLSGCSFEDSSVKSRVIELIKGTKYNRESNPRTRYGEGTRGDFEFSCSWRLYSLYALISDAKEFEEAGCEFGYWLETEPDAKST